MATLTKSTGTVILSGTAEKVTLPAAYGWVWLKNMSDSDMFAGLSADISEGADGVMVIPSGECGRIQTDGFNSIYLMGTGNALVVAQNYADCPFKAGVKGGEIPDLSAYAKKTDVPNIKVNSAGNADTVGGHTVGADVPADAVFTDTIPDLTPYALKSLYGDTTINIGRRENAPIGEYSTSLGIGTVANGYASTAEGSGSQAAGYASHAGGYNCQAFKEGSFAHGYQVDAKHEYETAFGKHNVSNDDTLFSIGDGSEINTDGNISIAYHNAFEITKTGGKLHDKDILTSAHIMQFIPYNLKYYAQNGRILLFSNDDALARGIYFVNNTPNDITVCALISASAAGPTVQYGYGSNTYPDIQNTGEGREWFSTESIQTSPTIFSMTVPSGKLGYYGLYGNSESAYTTIHDIRCPYFNYF